MVLQLAIVEDEHGFQEMLESSIRRWCDANHLEANIRVYPNSDAFLFAWEDRPNLDAIFLDIRMPGKDGMQIAHIIRETDAHVPLVFVTSLMERVFEGYEVGAVRYMLKPPKDEDVDACMALIAKEADQSAGRTILIRCEGQDVRIRYRQILYFENLAHYIHLYTTDGERYRFKMAIKDLEDNLPANFVRCHRSYIVNIEATFSLSPRVVTLRDAQRTELPISTSRMYAVQQAFVRFHKR